MKTAIYPGTFDPITNGHLNVLDRGLNLFDRVLVAVSTGTHKSPMFDLETRMGFIQELTKDNSKVDVIPLEGLLVECAKQHNADVILRGLRTNIDFEYEFQMTGVNRTLAPEIETVFLTPDINFNYISSSMVRELAKLKGDTSQFVPTIVHNALLK